MHYKSIPTLTEHQINLLWDKVDIPQQPSCCWNWTAHTSTAGYGCSHINGKPYQSHRVTYALLVGQPGDRQIDHLCRNRRCVNPDHMELVEQKTNVLRGYGAGACNARKTHCPHGHPYTLENTLIWSKHLRVCRECKRQKSVRDRIKKKEVRNASS